MYGFHYWYFKDISYKFKPYVRNKCHDISMMVYDLNDLMVLNIKGAVYRCVLWNMARNDGCNSLNNSQLDNKVHYRF